MPIVLTHEQIQKQSRQVFNQFGESKWKPNAEFNRKLTQANAEELRNVGAGRVMVLVAMGESLEGQIELLKKYRDRIDIAVCDKGFGPLLDHGIKADFVVLCDANIPYRFIGNWIHETKDVVLLSTVYGNPQWTEMWKGPRYFFINKDSIESEHFFRRIYGPETRQIPAGSNVGNAMVCFFIGTENHSVQNFAAYDRYLLCGYDYSWRPEGNYYAWMNPTPKRFYMSHRTLNDINGNLVFTSENLFFSAQWLYSYITNFGLPVINCSERGILDIKKGRLERNLETIRVDPQGRNYLKQLYQTLLKANDTFQTAKNAFENQRRVLTWQ